MIKNVPCSKGNYISIQIKFWVICFCYLVGTFSFVIKKCLIKLLEMVSNSYMDLVSLEWREKVLLGLEERKTHGKNWPNQHN